jgi:hypothetical protein
MYLNIDEIYTHLYEETVGAIGGNDERLLLAAISGAISESKGYLHAFDLVEIFGRTGDERDPLLLIWLKDIAVWHFINIARPAVDYDVRERRYNAAIAWLKGVQEGDIIPDFPRPVSPDTGEAENTTGIKFSSNTKRGNYI